MMKLLHSADWHLDSPIQGRTEAQTRQLKDALFSVPQQPGDGMGLARFAIAQEDHLDFVQGNGVASLALFEPLNNHISRLIEDTCVNTAYFCVI